MLRDLPTQVMLVLWSSEDGRRVSPPPSAAALTCADVIRTLLETHPGSPETSGNRAQLCIEKPHPTLRPTVHTYVFINTFDLRAMWGAPGWLSGMICLQLRA